MKTWFSVKIEKLNLYITYYDILNLFTMSQIKQNTLNTGESQTNISLSKKIEDSNPNSLRPNSKRPRVDQEVRPISHDTPNSLDVSELVLSETNLQKIFGVDPYIIINSIIKSGYLEKRYQAEFTAASKLSSSLDILTDNLSKQIFLIKDYDKLFNLLSYIAQEDTVFCKSIQKVIFLEKVSQIYANHIFSTLAPDIFNQPNSITPLLEKIANHILKTHNKNENKMCQFIFYLNNLWIDLEGWWKCCGPCEGVGGAGPAWRKICSPELKQTFINILKNIKNVKRDYCSNEIEKLCSSELFDIKNWRQYVQFQDSKEDVVMKSKTCNDIIWDDRCVVVADDTLQSSLGKEKLANAILSDFVKKMDTVTAVSDSSPGVLHCTMLVYQCDNADMMNDINQHINKLVRSCWKDDSYFQLKHYTCSDDWKKIHFNLYEIYTDPKIKKAYIDAANIS